MRCSEHRNDAAVASPENNADGATSATARNDDQGGLVMPLDGRGRNEGRPRFWRAALLLSLAATVSAFAHDRARAQPGFPTKPIHIFIPYGAGGVADLTMRLLAQKLTERTKQQVIIENRPGAGGLLSAKAVLDARPDGYSLGVIGNGQRSP
jgi:hypothetical protein